MSLATETEVIVLGAVAGAILLVVACFAIEDWWKRRKAARAFLAGARPDANYHAITYYRSRSGATVYVECQSCRWRAGEAVENETRLWPSLVAHLTRRPQTTTSPSPKRPR